uniref:G_PROTEIN_RECEP_F1_2 domain-containing protein n=1 Tax=Angiostrongylus cantonensis TaxID=6313 RepID=A0A0K0D2L3_ANGCA
LMNCYLTKQHYGRFQLTTNMVKRQELSMKMCMLALLLVSAVVLVAGGRFPDPPVFVSPQHYPSICYLPPGRHQVMCAFLFFV